LISPRNFFVTEAGTVLVNVPGLILRTTDLETYEEIDVSALIGTGTVFFAERDGEIICSGYVTGVFRSTDEGKTWGKVSDIPLGEDHVHDLAYDPYTDEFRFVCGDVNYPLCRTTDFVTYTVDRQTVGSDVGIQILGGRETGAAQSLILTGLEGRHGHLRLCHSARPTRWIDLVVMGFPEIEAAFLPGFYGSKIWIGDLVVWGAAEIGMLYWAKDLWHWSRLYIGKEGIWQLGHDKRFLYAIAGNARAKSVSLRRFTIHYLRRTPPLPYAAGTRTPIRDTDYHLIGSMPAFAYKDIRVTFRTTHDTDCTLRIITSIDLQAYYHSYTEDVTVLAGAQTELGLSGRRGYLWIWERHPTAPISGESNLFLTGSLS